MKSDILVMLICVNIFWMSSAFEYYGGSLDTFSIANISDIPHNETEVIIKWASLSTLPSYIFQNLTQCETLTIENSEVSTIESNAFWGLQSLKSLVLSCNYNLRILMPGMFLGLDECTELYFHRYTDCRSIGNILSEAFKGLAKLKKLSLAIHKLTSLRKGMFFHLDSLRSLNLGWNEISVIESDALQGMPNLRDLQLYWNKLTSLETESFNHLPGLEGLDVGGNCIEVIADGFMKKLPRLNTLRLYLNNFTALSADAFAGHAKGMKLRIYTYIESECVHARNQACHSDLCWLFIEEERGSISFTYGGGTGTGAFANFNHRQGSLSCFLTPPEYTWQDPPPIDDPSQIGCFLNSEYLIPYFNEVEIGRI